MRSVKADELSLAEFDEIIDVRAPCEFAEDHLPGARNLPVLSDEERVIVGTNGYSAEDLPPWFAARYMPTQSSVIVTRPLTEAELAAQGWTSHQASYDTRHLLHYFRLMPDSRMLFGVRGGLLSLEEACQRYTLTVEEFLSWQRSIERHGLPGLRATRVQQYRDHQ